MGRRWVGVERSAETLSTFALPRLVKVVDGKDPGGIIVTMLIGIAGSMLGGFIGRAAGWYGPGQAAGFLMSFLGAVILLMLYRMLVRRRTTL